MNSTATEPLPRTIHSIIKDCAKTRPWLCTLHIFHRPSLSQTTALYSNDFGSGATAGIVTAVLKVLAC